MKSCYNLVNNKNLNFFFFFLITFLDPLSKQIIKISFIIATGWKSKLPASFLDLQIIFVETFMFSLILIESKQGALFAFPLPVKRSRACNGLALELQQIVPDHLQTVCSDVRKFEDDSVTCLKSLHAIARFRKFFTSFSLTVLCLSS